MAMIYTALVFQEFLKFYVHLYMYIHVYIHVYMYMYVPVGVHVWCVGCGFPSFLLFFYNYMYLSYVVCYAHVMYEIYHLMFMMLLLIMMLLLLLFRTSYEVATSPFGSGSTSTLTSSRPL